MKKSLSVLLSLLIFGAGGFAEESVFGLSIEPVQGLRNGIISEYVYSTNSKTGEEYHLSLLDWEIKNTFYLGGNLDLRLQNFHLKAGIKTLFENENGFMEDSDWLQDAGYKTGNTSTKTNFSRHTCQLLNGLNFDINARYDFKPFDFWTIAPTVGFSYEQYKFMGKNGTAWYGYNKSGTPQNNYDSGSYYSYDDKSHITKLSFSGKVIKLEHADYYVWTGLSTMFSTPDKHWNFYLDFSIAPYTYMLVRDSHYLNTLDGSGTYYIDISDGYFSAFKASTYSQYKFNDMFAIKLSVSGLLTKELKGIEYLSNNYDSGYKKNKGAVIGASAKYFDIQLSANCTF